MTEKRIAVLVSGGGTNLQALIDAKEAGKLPCAKFVVVVSGKRGVKALLRADSVGIPTECVLRSDFDSPGARDAALASLLDSYKADLIVLAGFLSILGREFVRKYPNRIINIHPALIPSFCGKGLYGLEPHRRALEYGVKIVGATTHFVTEEPDGGPIIMQKAVSVIDGDTPESLQLRVMREAERPLIVESVRLFCEDRLSVDGRIVKVTADDNQTVDY